MILKKLVSKIVLITFFISISHNFTFAQAAAPTNFNKLILPVDMGKVTDSFEGTLHEKVICIEDLHCDPEVQDNIAKIIKEIKATYGKEFTFVGIEGSTGKINTTILSAVPDKDIKSSIAYEHLDNADISGAELYSILYPNTVKLYGLENPKLYKQDFTHLYNSFNYYNVWSRIFNNIEAAITEIKPYLYPKELIDFETIASSYDSGELYTYDYVSDLFDIAKKYNIDIASLYPDINDYYQANTIKKQINTDMLNEELNYIVKKITPKLSQTELNNLDKYKDTYNGGYITYLRQLINQKYIELGSEFNTVSKYFLYLDLLAKIDNIKFMQEEADLRYKIKLELASPINDARTVVFCNHFLNEMRAYLDTQAGSQDVTQWQAYKEEFFKTMQTFGALLTRVNYFKDYNDLLKKVNKNMDDFYNIADKRNEALLSNLLKASKSSPVKVIIFGGYHTAGMKESLRAQNISFDVVIPAATKAYDRTLYLNRIDEQAKLMGLNQKPTSTSTGATRFLMVMTKFTNAAFEQEIFSEIMNQYISKGKLTTAQDFIDFLNAYKKNMVIPDNLKDAILWKGKIEGEPRIIIYDYTNKQFKIETKLATLDEVMDLNKTLAKVNPAMAENVDRLLVDCSKIRSNYYQIEKMEILYFIKQYIEAVLYYNEISLNSYQGNTQQSYTDLVNKIYSMSQASLTTIGEVVNNLIQNDTSYNQNYINLLTTNFTKNLPDLKNQIQDFIDTNSDKQLRKTPLIDFSFLSYLWDDIRYLNTRSNFFKDIERLDKNKLRDNIEPFIISPDVTKKEELLYPILKKFFPNIASLFKKDESLKTLNQNTWQNILTPLLMNVLQYSKDNISTNTLIYIFQDFILDILTVSKVNLIKTTDEEQKEKLQKEIKRFRTAITEDMKRLSYIYPYNKEFLELAILTNCTSTMGELRRKDSGERTSILNWLIQGLNKAEILINLNAFVNKEYMANLVSRISRSIPLYSDNLRSSDTVQRDEAYKSLANQALLLYNSVKDNIKDRNIKNPKLKRFIKEVKEDDKFKLTQETMLIDKRGDIETDIAQFTIDLGSEIEFKREMSRAKKEVSKFLRPKNKKKELKYLNKNEDKYNKKPVIVKRKVKDKDEYRWQLNKKDNLRQIIQELYPNIARLLFETSYENITVTNLLQEKDVLIKLYNSAVSYYNQEPNATYMFAKDIFYPFISSLSEKDISLEILRGEELSDFKAALLRDIKRLNYLFPQNRDDLIYDTLLNYTKTIAGRDITISITSALVQTTNLIGLKIITADKDLETLLADTGKLRKKLIKITDEQERPAIEKQIKQKALELYNKLLPNFESVVLNNNESLLLSDLNIEDSQDATALTIELNKDRDAFLDLREVDKENRENIVDEIADVINSDKEKKDRANLKENQYIRKTLQSLNPNLEKFLFERNYKNGELQFDLNLLLKEADNYRTFYNPNTYNELFETFIVQLQDAINKETDNDKKAILKNELFEFRSALINDKERLIIVSPHMMQQLLILADLWLCIRVLDIDRVDGIQPTDIPRLVERTRELIQLNILEIDADANSALAALEKNGNLELRVIKKHVRKVYKAISDLFPNPDDPVKNLETQDLLDIIYQRMNMISTSLNDNIQNNRQIRIDSQQFSRFSKWLADDKVNIEKSVLYYKGEAQKLLKSYRRWKKDFVIRRLLRGVNPNMEKFIFSKKYKKHEMPFDIEKLIMFANEYPTKMNPDIYNKELFFSFILDISTEIVRTKNKREKEVLKQELREVQEAIFQDRQRMIHIFPYLRDLMLLDVLNNCAFVIQDSPIQIGQLKIAIMNIKQLIRLGVFSDDEVEKLIAIDIYNLQETELAKLASQIYNELFDIIEDDPVLSMFASELKFDPKSDADRYNKIGGIMDNQIVIFLVNLANMQLVTGIGLDSDSLAEKWDYFKEETAEPKKEDDESIEGDDGDYSGGGGKPIEFEDIGYEEDDKRDIITKGVEEEEDRGYPAIEEEVIDIIPKYDDRGSMTEKYSEELRRREKLEKLEKAEGYSDDDSWDITSTGSSDYSRGYSSDTGDELDSDSDDSGVVRSRDDSVSQPDPSSEEDDDFGVEEENGSKLEDIERERISGKTGLSKLLTEDIGEMLVVNGIKFNFYKSNEYQYEKQDFHISKENELKENDVYITDARYDALAKMQNLLKNVTGDNDFFISMVITNLYDQYNTTFEDSGLYISDETDKLKTSKKSKKLEEKERDYRSAYFNDILKSFIDLDKLKIIRTVDDQSILWKNLYNIQARLYGISLKVIDIEDLLKEFTTLETSSRDVASKPVFEREMIIPLSKIKAEGIIPYLKELGVYGDKRIKLVFVEDIADWEDEVAFKNAATTIRNLDAVWVLGKEGMAALDPAKRPDEDDIGKIMRDLNEQYIAIPAYTIASGECITSTGFVSIETLDALKKKRVDIDEREVAEILQVVLQFNTRVEGILGQDTFKDFYTELGEDETFTNRAKTLQEMIKTLDKEEEFDKFKYTYEGFVRLMSMRPFIYGDTGILNMTDPNYEKELEEKGYNNWFRQFPFGLEVKLDEKNTIITKPSDPSGQPQVIHILETLPDLRVFNHTYTIDENGKRRLTNTTLAASPAANLTLLKRPEFVRFLNELFGLTIHVTEVNSLVRNLYKPQLTLSRNIDKYADVAEAA